MTLYDFISLFGLPIAAFLSGIINLILCLTAPKGSGRRKGTKIAMIISFAVFGVIVSLMVLLFMMLMVGLSNM